MKVSEEHGTIHQMVSELGWETAAKKLQEMCKDGDGDCLSNAIHKYIEEVKQQCAYPQVCKQITFYRTLGCTKGGYCVSTI